MSATHDVESLLCDLATAVNRDHRRRRRQRLLGGLAAVAVVCTTGVALAGSPRAHIAHGPHAIELLCQLHLAAFVEEGEPPLAQEQHEPGEI